MICNILLYNKDDWSYFSTYSTAARKVSHLEAKQCMYMYYVIKIWGFLIPPSLPTFVIT